MMILTLSTKIIIKVLNMVVNIVNIRQLMCNLCIKELFIVVSIANIKLNGKETFSNMCNLCI